jgi:hypothetical protein
MNWSPRKLVTRFLVVVATGMMLAAAAPSHATSSAAASPVPTLAYYYIWFDKGSWNRAKMDYPLLGRYSSDDRAVMRQHILWAKAAGINGFIVSWKSTDVLNRRLQQLADVAEADNFRLAVIYQGLDFSRKPLPADRIASDLDFFIQHFASRKAFQLFQKPLVIWSGTWQFSAEDVSKVTQGRRNSLLILASEKNVSGYQRLADLVDGDAYYWSSVNPDTYSGYQDKLGAMSQAVHEHHGMWIPPAAPGFDARMIGGTSVVDRKNGDTLRTQVNTAMTSSPDALGIISWNEFSENSYVEPSKGYGAEYLRILSQINHLPPPVIQNFDSSASPVVHREFGTTSGLIALGGVAVVIIVAFILISRRSNHQIKNS